ncbi:MAG: lipopolysaccharide heptosyltransferase II [bacterium]|nr:lipopolysaccharide heptosyltransferase II [bacterium]
MTDSVENLIVLIPNWVGDIVMCTPALRVLHKRFPEARLTIVGRGTGCALLDGLPYIDRFVTVPARPGFAAMMRTALGLRHPKPDMAVLFPHSVRAALLARLTGAQRRLGYDRGGRWALLTDRVEPYREEGRIVPIYMGREYLDLVAALGCEDDGEGLELTARPDVVERVRTHMNGEGPLVGFAAGAAFGPSKQWPPERFAAVADALAEKVGARCVLLTGPGEEGTRDTIMETARTRIVRCDDGNPTIDTLKATISQLDLLVCNDSGPRHVGVAFKVPTVCIMGSTSPRYSGGPYEKGEVVRIDVDCGPCQKPVCEVEDHRCMTGIPPERVVEAVLRYLPV